MNTLARALIRRADKVKQRKDIRDGNVRRRRDCYAVKGVVADVRGQAAGV